MKKAEEKKLIKSLKNSLGENFNESNMLLITDLIDWVKISDHAKADLAKSVEENSRMDWQSLTTISMASKSIISIMKTLGITVNDQLKQKLLAKDANGNALDNLNKFLNG